MKPIILKARDVAVTYFKWGWPLFALDVILEMWTGHSEASWRGPVNGAAFVWLLCAPIALISVLLDRSQRERIMSRLCGTRENDERERTVTGDAARATLLFGLSLQAILLVMSMISIRLYWDTTVPRGEKPGTISAGLSFAPSRHLDPFGNSGGGTKYVTLGMPPEPARGQIEIAGGFLLAPSTFPVLALLILAQLAAFRIFALRRYEGAQA